MWLPTDVDDISDRENCVTLFNEAGLCATPYGQMEQVYFNGQTRDCGELWKRFFACTSGRSRGETPQRPKPPCIWVEKTKDEASSDWQAMFGHLKMQGTFPALDPDAKENARKEENRKWVDYFTQLASRPGKNARADVPDAVASPVGGSTAAEDSA